MIRRLMLWLLMPLCMWGVTITEDTTLSGDVVYNENVIVNGVVLNFNGFTMTVNGDLNISGDNARLQMTMSQDKLIVTGDLIFDGASTDGYLTNGVIELAGNFYQKGVYHQRDWYTNNTNNKDSFYPTDNHKVILNGNSKQVVDFESAGHSHFQNLEIQNTSTEGVYFKQLSIFGKWKRNDKHVTIINIRSWTLTEDYIIPNDITVELGTLNLNGFTLEVDGNVDITGDYARLKMVKVDDKLIVKGNLIFNGASTYEYLTNGVIEIAGNFYQKGAYHQRDWYSDNTNNKDSFYPTDKHKVILNGDSKQVVDFESAGHSHFQNLEIQNTSTDGVIFEQLSVFGEWKRNNKQVTIRDIRNWKLSENYTIPNNIAVKLGILNLNGFTLEVEGDVEIIGDYARLKMIKADDKLIVKGDLTFNGASTDGYLTNGVIELAGNFYQKGVYHQRDWYSDNANNKDSFYPTENHKLTLNGDSLQRVSFEAPDSSRFMNLEISNDNVIFDLEAGKKVSVVDNLYLDDSLYNSTYKEHEFLTYAHYRDIHKTYMTLYRGLNLVALPVKQTITKSQINTIFSDQNISHVLKYDSNSKKWYGFGNNEVARKKIADNNVAELTTIKAGEGFFVKAEGEVDLKFPRDDGYGIESMNIDELSSGWHLVGNNKVVKINTLLAKNSDIKVIRAYRDGKVSFWSADEDIKEEYLRRGIPEFEENNTTNSGFWLFID